MIGLAFFRAVQVAVRLLRGFLDLLGSRVDRRFVGRQPDTDEERHRRDGHTGLFTVAQTEILELLDRSHLH